MDISYFRSSSYNSWDFCQQQYYLNYVLGIPQDVNTKAQKGTMFHKVMECLALGKLSLQTGVPEIDDVAGQIDTARLYDDDYVDHLLNVSFEHYRAYKPELYPEKDKKEIKKWIIDTFNFNDGMFDPRNRNIFAAEQSFDFQIEEAWADKLRLRGTVDLITNLSDNIIEVIDWKGLEVNTLIPTTNGFVRMGDLKVGDTVFDKDGLKTKIVGQSKKSFKNTYYVEFNDNTHVLCDFEHLWMLNDGSVISVTELKVGHELIQHRRPGFNTYEKPKVVRQIFKTILDRETQCISVDSPSKTYLCTENFIPTHNTGQRKDWATGEEKDLKKLQKDPQLMIYFYALKHLFPTKTIMFTIYFARSGGPFTVYYDDETLTKVSELLEKRYLEIKKSKVPKLIDPSHRDFKCSKLCHYYKNNYEGTSIPICDYIHRKVVNDGISYVTLNMKYKDHSIDNYKAPGGSE